MERNISLLKGDLFENKRGVLVIPRSTSGSIHSNFEKGLIQLGVEPLLEASPIGSVTMKWEASSRYRELHIAYATSVNSNASDYGTIIKLAASLREQLDLSEKTVAVFCPLLGTGAGNLDPSSAFTYLTLPFLTQDRKYSFSIVVYDSVVYETISKIKIDRYDLVRNTIAKALQHQRKDPYLNDVVQSKEFFFQFAKDKISELLKTDLTENQRLNVLKEYQESKGSFQEFILKKNDQKIILYLLTIGEIITYLDVKAANRNEWNRYADKRAIARANIRQNDWVKNLIHFSINRDVKELPTSIRNAINFVLRPDHELPIISERDRQFFISAIGAYYLNERTFNELVREYFEQIKGPRPINSQNFGVLIGRLIYSPTIRVLWDLDLWKVKPSKRKQNNSLDTLISDEELEEETEQLIFNALQKTKVDNDSAFGATDLLDFEKDIRSFAMLIAMRDVHPPLAIALFGKWGSGKSFFMHHLERTVGQLSKHQSLAEHTLRIEANNANDEPFCRGIVQIKFNAWSYLDSNLWAGLVSTIFEKLDEYISDNVKTDKARNDVKKTLAERLQIVSEQRFLIEKEITELTENKKAIEAAIATTEKEKSNVIESIRKQSLKDIQQAAIEKIQPQIDQLLEKTKGAGITEQRLNELSPIGLYEEIKSWVTLASIFFRFNRSSIWMLLIPALLFVWLIIDPNDLIKANLDVMTKGASIIITFLAPFFVKLYQAVTQYKKLLHPVIKLKDEFIDHVRIAEFEHHTKLHSLESELDEKRFRHESLLNDLKNVESEINEVQYHLKHSITKKAFFDFIRRKNEDGSYEKHLGIISTIRKDFETLSDLFIGSNAELPIQQSEADTDFQKYFQKPLDRIVLYIDDLDRCPDDKVMDVLQAVHLLMAFPLFIVIVGVDKRCVHNALTHRNLLQYSIFSKTGKADELEEHGISIIKPSEYLEKIFQIPFHISDADTNDIKNLIHELLKNQVQYDEAKTKDVDTSSEPKNVSQRVEDNKPVSQKSETKKEQHPASNEMVFPPDLRFYQFELSYLKEICPIVGQTPRTIKRFINIYRIIRAHELLSYNEQSKEKSLLAVMFLLALTVGRFTGLRIFIETQCKIMPEDNLEIILKRTPNEIIDLLTGTGILPILLQMKGKDFIEHHKFVKRFSFSTSTISANKQQIIK